jgi:hypothetical protein
LRDGHVTSGIVEAGGEFSLGAGAPGALQPPRHQILAVIRIEKPAALLTGIE